MERSLSTRRGTVILTVLMAVSKFKALAFRARARRAKTKYRKQIESDDRRWGGRRLKLSGRAAIPIPVGTNHFPLSFFSFLKVHIQSSRNLWFIRIRNSRSFYGTYIRFRFSSRTSST